MKFRTLMQFLVAGAIFLTPSLARGIVINNDGSFSWTITAVQLTVPNRWEYIIDPEDLLEFAGRVDYDDDRLELTNANVNDTVSLLNGYQQMGGRTLGHIAGDPGPAPSTITGITGMHSAPPTGAVDVFSLKFRDLTPSDTTIPRLTFYDGDGTGPNNYVLTQNSTAQGNELRRDDHFIGATIPEPGSITLLSLGLFGLLLRRRRR